MNREAALAYIHGAPRTGVKSGPERFLALLSLLGDPHRQLRFVHIAGTNGKGSVAALTASMLQAVGLRTGRFVSPYLEVFEERISVNGQLIPEDELTACAALVRQAAERLPAQGFSAPTEFEVVTALGLVHFLRQNCDLVVLEVGIGGLRDITNVIDVPAVAVVTSVSLDHLKQLGPGLADIAAHKAGILKPGGWAAVYPDQPDVVWQALRRRAEAVGATLHVPDLGLLQVLREALEGTDFVYDGLALHNQLPGRHQVLNTLTAVTAVRLLAQRGIAVTDEAVARGVAQTRFAGRMEVLRHAPLVVLDGAHNPGGVQALEQAVRALLLPRVEGLVVVMGMMADKDWKACVPVLTALANEVILTAPPDPRALPPEQAAPLSRCPRTTCLANPTDALRQALAVAGPKDAVLVCGSLYLVGELRGRLTQLS